MSLLDQANKAALDAVRAEKPQSFTVGGSFDGTALQGGVTYDRKWSNGWGLTAYAKAWWKASAVTPNSKVEAGAEVTKRW